VRVIFTPRAGRHIDALHAYISDKASDVRADAYIARIVSFCNGLATFPMRGRKRDDLFPGLRTVGFERRVTVAFVVSTDVALIEAIFYGGQDFEATIRNR
jgi:toxin ParE1/3/4